MANDYFQFRQFLIRQDRCAMKVSTDAALLGAWARAGSADRVGGRILDIGTGTGVVALMMAQRYPESQVTAVEIDADGAAQARENVLSSPFSDRVTVVHADIIGWEPSERLGGSLFDAIVCNPPYFSVNPSRSAPSEERRRQARQQSSLDHTALVRESCRLLGPGGTLSVVFPTSGYARLCGLAVMAGLRVVRCCHVSTVAGKSPKRTLIEFTNHTDSQSRCAVSTVFLQSPEGSRSSWYSALTKSFYLPQPLQNSPHHD